MATLTARPQDLTSALRALNGRQVRKIGNNTALELGPDNDVYATLHGHRIVHYSSDGVAVSWAGYATSTTRDRINQLAPCRANIKNFEPYIDGEEVNNYRDWIKVS